MSTCIWCRHSALLQELTAYASRHGTRRALSATTAARLPRQISRPARTGRQAASPRAEPAGRSTRRDTDTDVRRSRPIGKHGATTSSVRAERRTDTSNNTIDKRENFDRSTQRHDAHHEVPSRQPRQGSWHRSSEVQPERSSKPELPPYDDLRPPANGRPSHVSQSRHTPRPKPMNSKYQPKRFSLPDATEYQSKQGALEGTDINVYSTSQAPHRQELLTAQRFFTRQSPNLLFSYPLFRSLPQSHHPEITVLGRSNVGKSSLLNALFSRNDLAHTSKKPGKTRLMNAYGVSPRPLSAAPQSGSKGEILANSWKRMTNGLMLIDQPGYGTGSHENWGREIMKYIENRKQLRRAFVLIDIEHGLKSTDLAIITHLYRHGIPHTIVLSKVDKYIYPGANHLSSEALSNATKRVHAQIAAIREQLRKEVWAGREAATDFLCVSAEKSMDSSGNRRRKFGVDELRWAMLCACGLQNEGIARKAQLNEINIID